MVGASSRAVVSHACEKDARVLLFTIHWWVPPTPEWQDQFTTMYMVWDGFRQAFWVERGCATLLAVSQNDRMLELCCGDGFYTRYFYSGRASTVTAVDFDADAIAYAREFNPAPNVTYQVADIREQIPSGEFDVVVWNGAIEHFTPGEIDAALDEISGRLRPGGIVCGYTIAATSDQLQLVHHEYEFRSKEDLLRFFTPRFANAKVFEEACGLPCRSFQEGVKRHNLYFFASDGVLPFDENWPAAASGRADPLLLSTREDMDRPEMIPSDIG